MSNQLIKTTGLGKENVFPRTRILDLFDETSGLKLIDILKSFNMMFVPYLGNKSQTRNQISPELRRQGLWLTYVIGNTVYTEWYGEVAIDDTNWGSDSNWRQGSNALVGDLSISPNGTWVINGEDSGITIKGDKGDSPVIRIYDNKILVSYDKGVTYEDLNNTPIYTKFRFNSLTNTYQVSYDLGGTWLDISDEKVYHKFRYNSTTNTYLESTDFGKTWSNISAEKVYYLFRYNAETNTHLVSTDLGLNWTDVSSNKVYYQFRTNDNRLLVSTDLGTTWENCSEPIAAWFRWASGDTADSVGKILISRDLLNWSDLSPNMTNNLYIKGYVATVGDLPTSSAAIGDIYMVGPTYDESDTTLDYPHYRMWVKQSSGWVDNGEYLSNVLISLNTGLETGITMSLKAITNIIDFLNVPLQLGYYEIKNNNITLNLNLELFYCKVINYDSNVMKVSSLYYTLYEYNLNYFTGVYKIIAADSSNTVIKTLSFGYSLNTIFDIPKDTKYLYINYNNLILDIVSEKPTNITSITFSATGTIPDNLHYTSILLHIVNKKYKIHIDDPDSIISTLLSHSMSNYTSLPFSGTVTDLAINSNSKLAIQIKKSGTVYITLRECKEDIIETKIAGVLSLEDIENIDCINIYESMWIISDLNVDGKVINFINPKAKIFIKDGVNITGNLINKIDPKNWGKDFTLGFSLNIADFEITEDIEVDNLLTITTYKNINFNNHNININTKIVRNIGVLFNPSKNVWSQKIENLTVNCNSMCKAGIVQLKGRKTFMHRITVNDAIKYGFVFGYVADLDLSVTTGYTGAFYAEHLLALWNYPFSDDSSPVTIKDINYYKDRVNSDTCGFFLNRDDAEYTNLVSVNYLYGAKVRADCTIKDFHPWSVWNKDKSADIYLNSCCFCLDYVGDSHLLIEGLLCDGMCNIFFKSTPSQNTLNWSFIVTGLMYLNSKEETVEFLESCKNNHYLIKLTDENNIVSNIKIFGFLNIKNNEVLPMLNVSNNDLVKNLDITINNMFNL